MNTSIIEGNWDQLKGKIKQQWGKLKETDLKEKLDYEQLAEKLQRSYGYAKEEAKKELDSFIEDTCGDEGKNVTRQASELRTKAGKFINESIDSIKEKSAEVPENIISYITKHPAKAMLAAVATGMVLSRLLSK